MESEIPLHALGNPRTELRLPIPALENCHVGTAYAARRNGCWVPGDWDPEDTPICHPPRCNSGAGMANLGEVKGREGERVPRRDRGSTGDGVLVSACAAASPVAMMSMAHSKGRGMHEALAVAMQQSMMEVKMPGDNYFAHLAIKMEVRQRWPKERREDDVQMSEERGRCPRKEMAGDETHNDTQVGIWARQLEARWRDGRNNCELPSRSAESAVAGYAKLCLPTQA